MWPHELTQEERERGARLGGRATAAQAARADSHVAKQIVEMRAKAGYSLRRIADVLNTCNRKTRRGKKWTAMQVKRVYDRASRGLRIVSPD
jgi:hypothetical protein